MSLTPFLLSKEKGLKAVGVGTQSGVEGGCSVVTFLQKSRRVSEYDLQYATSSATPWSARLSPLTLTTTRLARKCLAPRPLMQPAASCKNRGRLGNCWYSSWSASSAMVVNCSLCSSAIGRGFLLAVASATCCHWNSWRVMTSAQWF